MIKSFSEVDGDRWTKNKNLRVSAEYALVMDKFKKAILFMGKNCGVAIFVLTVIIMLDSLKIINAMAKVNMSNIMVRRKKELSKIINLSNEHCK